MVALCANAGLSLVCRQLMQQYGFILPGNPFDRLPLAPVGSTSTPQPAPDHTLSQAGIDRGSESGSSRRASASVCIRRDPVHAAARELEETIRAAMQQASTTRDNQGSAPSNSLSLKHLSAFSDGASFTGFSAANAPHIANHSPHATASTPAALTHGSYLQQLLSLIRQAAQICAIAPEPEPKAAVQVYRTWCLDEASWHTRVTCSSKSILNSYGWR